eukprot:TRINITY_DN1496_c0_g2_i1.p1 TRINITY_DN1496_c0_g2~~TRINITY_DN1496_c0_g2_i1.p1  ORF type:complete len:492 (-),score=119.56 TRINITY_DN1496_c0_g2_i1:34-1509(-)
MALACSSVGAATTAADVTSQLATRTRSTGRSAFPRALAFFAVASIAQTSSGLLFRGSSVKKGSKHTADLAVRGCEWVPASSCVDHFVYEGEVYTGRCSTASPSWDGGWCSQHETYQGLWSPCTWSCTEESQDGAGIIPHSHRIPSAQEVEAYEREADRAVKAVEEAKRLKACHKAETAKNATRLKANQTREAGKNALERQAEEARMLALKRQAEEAVKAFEAAKKLRVEEDRREEMLKAEVEASQEKAQIEHLKRLESEKKLQEVRMERKQMEEQILKEKEEAAARAAIAKAKALEETLQIQQERVRVEKERAKAIQRQSIDTSARVRAEEKIAVFLKQQNAIVASRVRSDMERARAIEKEVEEADAKVRAQMAEAKSIREANIAASAKARAEEARANTIKSVSDETIAKVREEEVRADEMYRTKSEEVRADLQEMEAVTQHEEEVLAKAAVTEANKINAAVQTAIMTGRIITKARSERQEIMAEIGKQRR